MNKGQLIEQLQRKLAEEKAKTKQLEKTVNIISKQKSTAEKELDKTTDENKKLRIFISSLKDSYNVSQMYKWASKNEKFKSSDLNTLKQILFSYQVSPKEIANEDIAEAGNCTLNLNNEDIPKGLYEEDLVTTKKALKRGRQPNVKTCGRDNKVFDHLDVVETIVDNKEKILRENPNLKLTFERVDTNLQLDFIESHNITRKTVTYIYRDQYGNLHDYNFNNPKVYDFVKNGKLTNRFISSIIADKVIYGQPLHLLTNKMNLVANYDIVNNQLLCSNFMRVGERLAFFAELIRTKILSECSFHADETRLKVIDYKDKTKEGSKLGYMWSLSCDSLTLKAVYYMFNLSRSAAVASQLIEGAISGAIQVDGYNAYVSAVRIENERILQEVEEEDGLEAADTLSNNMISSELKGLVLVGCMAHARRRIKELQNSIYKKKPKSSGAVTCSGILALIMKIYAVEKSTRKKYNDGTYNEEDFIKIRKEKTKPYIVELLSYAQKRVKKHPTEIRLRKALNYIINQHKYIKNYLDFSALTPDNNFQERQFRSTIIRTRNNSLFASNENGAKAWAVNTTITQSAVLNNINPTHYLKYILDEVGSNLDKPAKSINYEKLLPWNVDYKTVEEAWLR